MMHECGAVCGADAAALGGHVRDILEESSAAAAASGAGGNGGPTAISAAEVKHFCKHARYLRCACVISYGHT